MNLAARRSSRQRENFVMRLGCVLVSVAVLASLVLEPPRAKAFAATSAAVSALAGGFLNACGLAPVVSGMSSSGEVNESLTRLVQDYLDTIGSPTPEEWLGQELGLTLSGGKIYLPKPIAAKLGQFAAWVAGKYAAKPGVNQVYSQTGFTAANGLYYELGKFVNSTTGIMGTNILESTVIGSEWSIPLTDSLVLTFRCVHPSDYWNKLFVYIQNDVLIGEVNLAALSSGVFYTQACFILYNDGKVDRLCVMSYAPASSRYHRLSGSIEIPVELGISESLLSVDVSDTMQQVLDRLTALEEGQSIALDVGATSSMEIQDILQGILDKILAGDLTATAEVVDTAEVPVDPPDPPVVPELPTGLDKLGAALTSRFPFSVPWDVYKGVKLLAAPAKAPYFEVDFFEPIGHLVGGWQGSTKIVLDMSEYEIIGQVSRWTSTIGFCLMLASGTKRLIWTA